MAKRGGGKPYCSRRLFDPVATVAGSATIIIRFSKEEPGHLLGHGHGKGAWLFGIMHDGKLVAGNCGGGPRCHSRR